MKYKNNVNKSKKNDEEILEIIDKIKDELSYLFYIYDDTLPDEAFEDLMDKIYKLIKKIENR